MCHINKSSIGKRLAGVCSVSINNISNVIFGIFTAHLHEMAWFKKAETEDIVKGLDKFAQKLDVVAAVIFTCIDVKGQSQSKQQQSYHVCHDHFLHSGRSSCGGTISFLKTIVECCHMECSLSPMRPLCYIIPTTEIYF